MDLIIFGSDPDSPGSELPDSRADRPPYPEFSKVKYTANGEAVTRIALLSDVHANLPALEAVLVHATEQGIGAYWNLGDFVGYGAYPDQVVQRLRRLPSVNIVGNYDLKVLKIPQKKSKWRGTKHPQKFLAFRWAYENLSPESRQYLKSLPQEVRLTEEGFSILLTHGSPASNKEPLSSQTATPRLGELATLAGTDLILCGHSHEPFIREVEGVWFINPGSVGRPGDGDPRASYAILALRDHNLQVEHFRLAYDVDQAVTALRRAGLPEIFSKMLVEGRSLDEVEGDS